ncbi:hypothetical protein [Pseudoxanthomonas gei]|uniref:hypothetical protein n=1 Tax=Pseudoxanthomonas gei TaxID=1383030 RepID=UPI001B8659ED|nr:hypothetical protein [Pseudoxanthomonas gei]
MKKLRLLVTLMAASALGGCATYDYVGGNSPGGYYSGRASTGTGYGPYYDGYGYPSYLYGNYGYRSYYGPSFYNPYYYGYGGYPYYPPRPHHPRPPRPDHENDGKPPPWRNPLGDRPRGGEGRLQPGGGPVPINNPRSQVGPERGEASPQIPRPAPQRGERSRPPPQRSTPEPGSQNRDRVRTQEP